MSGARCGFSSIVNSPMLVVTRTNGAALSCALASNRPTTHDSSPEHPLHPTCPEAAYRNMPGWPIPPQSPASRPAHRRAALGNARTALFSLLLARHSAGRFMLRIEDTDLARSRRSTPRSSWTTCAGSASTGTQVRIGRTSAGPTASPRAAHSTPSISRRCSETGAHLPVLLHAARAGSVAQDPASAGRPPRYAGTCRELTPEQPEPSAPRASRPPCGSACRPAAASSSRISCTARRVS